MFLPSQFLLEKINWTCIDKHLFSIFFGILKLKIICMICNRFSLPCLALWTNHLPHVWVFHFRHINFCSAFHSSCAVCRGFEININMTLCNGITHSWPTFNTGLSVEVNEWMNNHILHKILSIISFLTAATHTGIAMWRWLTSNTKSI